MAEDFGDAPGLRNTTHRPVRRLRLKDFADRPQSSIVKVRQEWLKQPPDQLRITLESKVGIEIRSHKPWPRHAHVVCGVARALIALIGRLITGVVGTQRP